MHGRGNGVDDGPGLGPVRRPRYQASVSPKIAQTARRRPTRVIPTCDRPGYEITWTVHNSAKAKTAPRIEERRLGIY